METNLIEKTENIEVKNLTGNALNWAVAIAKSFKPTNCQHEVQSTIDNAKNSIVFLDEKSKSVSIVTNGLKKEFSPSSSWTEEVGEIMENHVIKTGYLPNGRYVVCDGLYGYGEDLLTALCRAFVSCKIGTSLNIPKNLIN